LKQVNHQTPVKADRHDDGSLLIHSIFLTIQGEGPNVGQPAIFVRLAGCNIQCPGCDTEYTGDAVQHMDFHTLTDAIEQYSHDHNPLVVITGGEPLRQNIIPFLNWLAKHRYRTQLETNGTLGIDKRALSDDARYNLEIVCSPKTPKVVESLQEFIIAYKYVVNQGDIDPVDGLPLGVLGLHVRPARPHSGYRKKVYVQPADEYDPARNKRNLDTAVNICLTYGHTLCLQTHKYINMP